MIRTNAVVRFAAVAALVAGFATAASAEQPGPRLVGSGNDVTVVYPAPSANVVGGAHARLIGSGETTAVEVIGAATVVEGSVASLVGSGETQTVIYADPMAGLRATQVTAAGEVRG